MPKIYHILFLLGCLLFPGLVQPLYADAQTISLLSQNLNRFFNDKADGYKEKIDSTKRYRKRLDRLVNRIHHDFNNPDILALQEVENLAVLKDISRLLQQRYQQQYRAILIEGHDQSGIDVGFLVKSNYLINSTQALFSSHTIPGSKAPLFTRPPLLIEICATTCLNLVNVHLRSMRGLRSPKKSNRVAHKRRSQATTLARWINSFQQQNPQQKLIILGDFNALNPSDAYVDVIGTVMGDPDKLKPRYPTRDLIHRDLLDISTRVPSRKRFSYSYKGRKQQLDYMLVSKNLDKRIRSVRFSTIDYSVSDHAAIMSTIRLDNM